MADIESTLNSLGLELIDANIGSGGSAIVHKGRVIEQRDGLPPEGTLIAVKEYKPSILEIDGREDRIQQEAEIAGKQDHQNLISAYGLHRDANDVPILLLEWVYGTSPPSGSGKLNERCAKSFYDGYGSKRRIASEEIEALRDAHLFHQYYYLADALGRGDFAFLARMDARLSRWENGVYEYIAELAGR